MHKQLTLVFLKILPVIIGIISIVLIVIPILYSAGRILCIFSDLIISKIKCETNKNEVKSEIDNQMLVVNALNDIPNSIDFVDYDDEIAVEYYDDETGDKGIL